MDSVSIEPIPTRQLLLQPLDPLDAAEMVEVLADQVLYEFTGGEPPDLDTLGDRYRSQVRGPADGAEVWYNWIVRRADDRRAVGFVQATVAGEEADVAWLVGVDFQGHGFASEAAKAMCGWLARNGVHRITAHVHPDHVASQKVAEAVHLAVTGEVDEDGEEIWRQADVEVFFYGTFMSREVLAVEFGVDSSHGSAAQLDGFHLTIGPRVNIERRPGSVVFGSVVAVDGEDLLGLYRHLEHEYGLVYEPLVVEVSEAGAVTRQVTVYVAGEVAPAPADPAYVHQLAECVRQLGHPEQYAEHIESFLV